MDDGFCEVALNFKSGNDIYIMPLTGRVEAVTRSQEMVSISYSDSYALRYYNEPDTVEFTFCGHMVDPRFSED